MVGIHIWGAAHENLLWHDWQLNVLWSAHRDSPDRNLHICAKSTHVSLLRLFPANSPFWLNIRRFGGCCLSIGRRDNRKSIVTSIPAIIPCSFGPVTGETMPRHESLNIIRTTQLGGLWATGTRSREMVIRGCESSQNLCVSFNNWPSSIGIAAQSQIDDGIHLALHPLHELSINREIVFHTVRFSDFYATILKFADSCETEIERQWWNEVSVFRAVLHSLDCLRIDLWCCAVALHGETPTIWQ
jgi:hypothetical protein